MKITIIFEVLMFLSVVFSFGKVHALEKKRILMYVFPGGKSHNFVIRSLFNYTLTHKDKYDYEFHLLVHSIDADAWKDAKEENGFFIYSFGNKEQYQEYFGKSIEMMNKNPNFGFFNFNDGMLFVYKEFLESGRFEELKKIKFDAIGTDIASYIHVVLANELKIPNKFYLSPPSLPQLMYSDFEINPNYLPAIGTKYTNVMTFSQRFMNHLFQNGAQIMFNIFQGQHRRFFGQYGHTINQGIYFSDSMHFLQYPLGIAFPISTPPNFVMLNAITPKEAQPLKNSNKEIDNFLTKYKYNIYLSQGTIMNILDFDEQIKLFEYFNKKGDTGFILSAKDETIAKYKSKFPKNVISFGWVPQNDLLGDDRLSLFITHGGINSVSESIYHRKPMVVLGLGLDQFNTASYVKKLKMGVVFQDKKLVTSDSLISAVNEVLSNEMYLKNVIKSSKVMRSSRDPREEFKFWLDFGLENGYDSLYIDMIIKGNWISIYGLDVLGAYLLIVITIILLNVWVMKKLYRCFCGQCEGKKRRKAKIE